MGLVTVQFLNALLYSAIIFLIAGGLSLIFGVMRIVNLAHGSLYALGAYAMAWMAGMLATRLPAPALLVFVPAAACAVAAAGLFIEPSLLRPLYRRPEEYQLLATFGLLLLLEDFIRYIWGPTPLTLSTLWASFPPVTVFGAPFPTYNLLVIAVGLMSAIALRVLVYRTRFGVILQATSQDMRMAAALGIDVRRVYLQAFALGCLMAGLAGAVIVPLQGAVLGMGLDALILAFVAVTIGGLGSLEGALVGALIVGLVRTVAIAKFPELELAVLYLIAAVVLVVRPGGLFGRP